LSFTVEACGLVMLSLAIIVSLDYNLSLIMAAVEEKG
jgi:hypothetical protein